MSRFDFSGFDFFSNNSSKKNADKRRRGRSCRIEELEGREMLSVSPWSLASDHIDYQPEFVQTETPQVNENLPGTILTAAPEVLATPLEASGVPVGTIGTAKIAVDKAYTSANSIGLSVDKGNGVASVTNGYKVTTAQGEATGLSYVTVNGGIVTHAEYSNSAHGTIKSIIITGIDGKALDANTKYDKIIVSATDEAREIKSAKTTKYAALKMKVDTKGAIVNASHDTPYAVTNKVSTSPYQTTIDSFTLTWTANRPVGETFDTITLTTGKVGKPGYINLILGKDTSGNWVAKTAVGTTWFGEVTEGTGWTGKANKPQTLVNFLQITGLQSGTKYTVELDGCKYGSTPLAGKAPKVSASTAKWAAPKPNVKALDIKAESITIDIAVPDMAKTTNYAAGQTYEWFAIYGALPDGKKVDADQFLGLVQATKKDDKTVTVELKASILGGVKNFDATKAYTFFCNAVTIGDGVSKEIVLNQSAQGKFTVKKGLVDATKLSDWATKAAAIPKFSEITASDMMDVTLKWGTIADTATYQVQYRKMGAGTWTTIPGIVETTRVIPDLDAGTQYEFQVQAGTTGAWSQSAFMTTKDGIPKISEITVAGTDVTLKWEDIAGAVNGYQVQYRKVGVAAWSAPVDVAAGTTTTTVFDLDENTRYEFQVLSKLKTETSSWSPSAFITTVYRKLATPTISATASGTTAITVTWSTVPDADSFLVEWNTIDQWGGDKGSNYGSFSAAGTDTTHTIDGLTEGESYYIRVTAQPSSSAANPQSDPAVTRYTAGGILSVADLAAGDIGVGGDNFVSTVTFTAPPVGTTTLYYVEIPISPFTPGVYENYGDDFDAAKADALANFTANPTTSGWTAVPAAQIITNDGTSSYEYTHAIPEPGSWNDHRGWPTTITIFACVTQYGDEVVLSGESGDIRIQNICDQGAYFGDELVIKYNGDGTLTIDWQDCDALKLPGRDPIVAVMPQYLDGAQWKNFEDFDQNDPAVCHWEDIGGNGEQPAYVTLAANGAYECRILYSNGNDWNVIAGEAQFVSDLSAPQHVHAADVKGDNFVTNVTFTDPGIGTTTLYWIDTNALATHYGGVNNFDPGNGGDWGALDTINATNAVAVEAAKAALQSGNMTGWTAASAGEVAYSIQTPRMYTSQPHAWVYFVCATEVGDAVYLSGASGVRINELVDQTQHDPANVVTVTNNGDGTLTLDWRNCPHPTMYAQIRGVTPQYKDADGHWQNCEVLETTPNNGVVVAAPGQATRPDEMPISVKVTNVGATEFRVIDYACVDALVGVVPVGEEQWSSVDWNIMFGTLESVGDPLPPTPTNIVMTPESGEDEWDGTVSFKLATDFATFTNGYVIEWFWENWEDDDAPYTTYVTSAGISGYDDGIYDGGVDGADRTIVFGDLYAGEVVHFRIAGLLEAGHQTAWTGWYVKECE